MKKLKNIMAFLPFIILLLFGVITFVMAIVLIDYILFIPACICIFMVLTFSCFFDDF